MLVCGDRARSELRRLMWWFAGVPAAALAPTQVLSAPLSQPKPQSLISEASGR